MSRSVTEVHPDLYAGLMLDGWTLRPHSAGGAFRHADLPGLVVQAKGTGAVEMWRNATMLARFHREVPGSAIAAALVAMHDEAVTA